MQNISLWAEKRLRLLVTSDCNMTCYYCHNEGQSKGSSYMSRELFYKIVHLVTDSGEELNTITFSGGEPLLHPDLAMYLRTLKSFSKELTVVTNGVLLDQKKLDTLIQSGITKIRLGFDSISRRQSKPTTKLVKTPSIIRQIEMIRKAGVPLEFNIVLTKYNLNEIEGILELCRNTGLSAKFFEQVIVQNSPLNNLAKHIGVQPEISFNVFHKKVIKMFPFAQHGNDPLMGLTNYLYKCNGFTIRYCRYLCLYRLCYLTGTRIDAEGFTFTCMKQRGSFQIYADEPLKTSRIKIYEAVQYGCGK